MNREDLDQLEQDPRTQQLIQDAKSLRNRENESLAPPSFKGLSGRLSELERGKKTPLSRLHFPFRSLWWMTAACLAGVLIGWHIPRPGGEMAGLHTLYDTIRTTDTIIKEVEKPVTPSRREGFFLTSSDDQAGNASLRKKKRPSRHSDSTELISENPVAPSPYPVRGRSATSDIPVSLDDIPQERRGRSVAEENFPFYLISQ